MTVALARFATMKRERYKIIPAIFAVLIDEEHRVLLHRRYRTGYMDGYYDFPSGHLEEGETLQEGAARELKEETGIIIAANKLALLHINQNYSDPEKPYINFMFLGRHWAGVPRIGESDKCDHLDFFAMNDLPKITPQVEATLSAFQEGMLMSFSQFDAGSIWDCARSICS